MSDEDIRTQTSSYVPEEQRLFETAVRDFIDNAGRWFAEADTDGWEVTLEVSP